MKTKSKNKSVSDSGDRKVVSQVTRAGEVATIFHSQSLKQSLNYQSADCAYGVTLTVPDSGKDIVAGMRRAEKIVEALIEAKIKEQRQLLQVLGPS